MAITKIDDSTVEEVKSVVTTMLYDKTELEMKRVQYVDAIADIDKLLEVFESIGPKPE